MNFFLLKKKFRMSSLSINKLYFFFNSENISCCHCTVKYEIFNFLFLYFLFDFYCFHYLNRSYGRFVLVFNGDYKITPISLRSMPGKKNCGPPP